MAAEGHGDDNGVGARLPRGKRVRHEWRDEVAVAGVHGFATDHTMPVRVVEIHRADEERGLHHQVAVIELDVRMVRIAARHDAQLLDPLRAELAAPAHRRIAVLVIRRPLAARTGSIEHARGRLGCISGEQPHAPVGVVGVEPQVVERHRVDLAHAPQDIQGVTHVEVAAEKALELREVHIELLGDDGQRPLQVVRLAEQASAHRSDLHAGVVLRQEHRRVILRAGKVLGRVHFVPTPEDHDGFNRPAVVRQQL
mmetsp:Transcript_68714/g.199352  ORF Transcript_68714/g.199352 Transcript_68714/m.199352 type:complete len:254 (+) Transcript_68714:653-1414(+)